MNSGKLKDWHEALPLVARIYRHHGAGCCWHILLDDGNVDDDSVEFCASNALNNDDCRTPDECRALADVMRKASRTQRAKIAKVR